MAAPSSFMDKFFERVINPDLSEVMKHPQAIEMCEGMLHIWDVHGPKKTGSLEARLEGVEQEIFKCQGMVERGLSAHHSMITEFTRDHKVDGRSMKDIVFTFTSKSIFCKAKSMIFKIKFSCMKQALKGMSLADSCRTQETRASSYDGEPLPWKPEDNLTTSSPPPPPSPKKET
ncbi:uncharacterized protein [Aegilops tauschii subsp. strangulata]|uniref:uncharacterized protein n=1 Tax=Aegilops tauschii subsp. strangulata TaxID=200361 RepID=UPI00098B75BC|nr:uncharacterized protein LOC109764271 [Aegilops tauschii subsp. strangulata]